MRNVRRQLESFGGLIDVALRQGYIDCQVEVNSYDAIVGAPTYNVSGSSESVRWAHDRYRAAIGVFSAGAADMTQNCRNYLINPQPGSIGFQQWGPARQQVNAALETLAPAIARLEQEGY